MSYHQFADTDPIRHHKEAITALQKDVLDITSGRVEHLKENPDGLLNESDNENMLRVTKARIKTHRECLALARHYAGEPLVWPK